MYDPTECTTGRQAGRGEGRIPGGAKKPRGSFGLRLYPLGALRGSRAATRFQADRSRSRAKDLSILCVATGADAEASVRTAGPLPSPDKGASARRPCSVAATETAFASLPLPKQRSQTQPSYEDGDPVTRLTRMNRCRLFRGAEPSTTFVADPLVPPKSAALLRVRRSRWGRVADLSVTNGKVNDDRPDGNGFGCPVFATNAEISRAGLRVSGRWPEHGKTPRKYRPKPQPSRGSLPFTL